MMRALYWGVLLPVLWLAARVVARWQPKVCASLRGRSGAWNELNAAAERRDPARPLVWMHAASAGEFLQAEPILRRLRADGSQLAVSLSSPSGVPWLARIADWPELIWSGLLPFDFPRNVRRLLEGLRPTAIVYVQADLWPGLVWGAASRGIPQVVIAARLTPRGAWVDALRRPLLRSRYAPLTALLCLGEGDRARLAELLPGHGRIEVAGDPGIETVLRRMEEAGAPSLPQGWAPAGAPVVVVGSSWPADEQRWVSPLLRALAAHPAARAVVAPHEPTPARLAGLEAALAPVGTCRLSALEADPAAASGARVVLVDAVGKLAALYRVGTIAYVGGGFSTGVHNVAEPAACGLPVLFGPRHENSLAAASLLTAGGAFVVSDEESLGRQLAILLADSIEAARRGGLGREVIAGQSGAAEQCHAVIRDVVRRAHSGGTVS